MSQPSEHDYIGFKSPSPMEQSSDSSSPAKSSAAAGGKPLSGLSLNLKATELRLGLPGSESPERDNGSNPELYIGFNNNNNGNCCGAKRGFSVAIHGGSTGDWVFSGGESDTTFSSPRNPTGNANVAGKVTSEQAKAAKEGLPPQSSPADAAAPENKKTQQQTSPGAPPASKAQVVGWPPIRSFRKNTMASHPAKNSEAVEGGDPQLGESSGCLYVKVSMDGAPYLRKVDLNTYGGYKNLSLSLEKMFSCFTIGQCGSHGLAGKDGASESRLVDILHGSEYVLTYEDKDGDWMLVGDVPWKMFIDSCRRLRIMKSSDAIGLAPRAFEKCKSIN